MTARTPRRSRACGFSLLEAIVAMVLIAGAGLALFSWISNNITSLASIEDVNRRSEATINVLEYMELVNPMEAPEGSAILGGYSITWRAHLASPITDGVDHPRGVSAYQFALYRVDVAAASPQGAWFDLRLNQVGYKRVRTIAPLD